jgi:hypothetical protein
VLAAGLPVGVSREAMEMLLLSSFPKSWPLKRQKSVE